MAVSAFTKWMAGKLSQSATGEKRKAMLEGLQNDPKSSAESFESHLRDLTLYYVMETGNEVLIGDVSEEARQVADYMKNELLKNELAAL
jgi:hypothetical protein